MRRQLRRNPNRRKKRGERTRLYSPRRLRFGRWRSDYLCCCFEEGGRHLLSSSSPLATYPICFPPRSARSNHSQPQEDGLAPNLSGRSSLAYRRSKQCVRSSASVEPYCLEGCGNRRNMCRGLVPRKLFRVLRPCE